MSFLALFVSLPAKAQSERVRVWRSLKALGCATLRDGVYLLPASAERLTALNEVAKQAAEAGGNAEVYRLAGVDDAQELALRMLFERRHEYASIAAKLKELSQQLSDLSVDGATIARKVQSVARHHEQLVSIDFFADETQRQTSSLLDSLRQALHRRLAGDEPSARQSEIPLLDRGRYQRRTWATRARPWVDRLASAWLIRRYIDAEATFIWLTEPAACRSDWLGFDFDGAPFSHVGDKVTFETLLASFGLEQNPALGRLAELVHCLDVGGLPVADAPGIESLLAGLRAAETNDDVLLDRACQLFDWLLHGYEERQT